MGDRAPAYRDPALHFDALRLVALHEGDRTQETLATENEKKNACTRTCARALSPRSSLLLEQACSPLLARSANWLDDLMAPAWRPALCLWGVILGPVLRGKVGARA